MNNDILNELSKIKVSLETKYKERYTMPTHIYNVIMNKTEETASKNKDNNFDKESFKLGMMYMYFYLDNSNKLK
jgi:hypothetical protein